MTLFTTAGEQQKKGLLGLSLDAFAMFRMSEWPVIFDASWKLLDMDEVSIVPVNTRVFSGEISHKLGVGTEDRYRAEFITCCLVVRRQQSLRE